MVSILGCTTSGHVKPKEMWDGKVFDKTESIHILVLGNSFIWTSQVEEFLNRVCVENQVDAKITSMPVGMSNVKQHSTPMAGYAGACLVYSRLFKEIPKVETINQYLLQKFLHLVPGETEEEKLKNLAIIPPLALKIVQEQDEVYINLRS